jgi:hypothetical protein
MGIECVYDATVVTVIADWTIEMVKRGPRGTSVPQPADRHARRHAEVNPRDTSCIMYPSSVLFFYFSLLFIHSRWWQCDQSLLAECKEGATVRIRMAT